MDIREKYDYERDVHYKNEQKSYLEYIKKEYYKEFGEHLKYESKNELLGPYKTFPSYADWIILKQQEVIDNRNNKINSILNEG